MMKPTPQQLFEAALSGAKLHTDPTVIARRMTALLKLYAPVLLALADTIAEAQTIVDTLPVSSKIKAQQLLDEAKAALGYTCNDEKVQS